MESLYDLRRPDQRRVHRTPLPRCSREETPLIPNSLFRLPQHQSNCTGSPSGGPFAGATAPSVCTICWLVKREDHKILWFPVTSTSRTTCRAEPPREVLPAGLKRRRSGHVVPAGGEVRAARSVGPQVDGGENPVVTSDRTPRGRHAKERADYLAPGPRRSRSLIPNALAGIFAPG